MLKNGVPMKNIQEWLGHADFGTTANIYSHLDYSAKQSSANTISNVFNFVEQTNQPELTNQEQEIEVDLEKEKEKEEQEKKELQERIALLEEQLRKQREDEEYQEYLRQREERRRKQKDSEMEM